MISFRYHLVSIVAVFLALGLGILAGTTVLNQRLVANLKDRTKAAERQVLTLRDQLQQLKGEVGTLQSFIQQARPFLIGGELAGQEVVLVTQSGSDPAALGEARSSLTEAGAKVTVLQVTARMALTDDASRRDLATLMGMPSSDDPEALQVEAARMLGDRLAQGPPPTDLASPQAAPRDLLDGLLSKGFLTSTISPADLPLVGGAGQAVVVVAGGNSAPAVPIESFLLPFVADLELYPGVPVAAAESTTTATFPFVSLLRDDGQLKSDPMVTVDDVDPDHAGGIALVLGLKNLLSLGTGGNYGLKDGNDGLLPKAA